MILVFLVALACLVAVVGVWGNRENVERKPYTRYPDYGPPLWLVLCVLILAFAAVLSQRWR